MSFYVNPIRTALLISPYLGLLVAMPYAVVCYRRTRYIPVNRCAYIYFFTIYILSVYFLTMMPFPSQEKVAAMTGPCIQYIPFTNLADFYENSGFLISELRTYIPSLKSGIFLEIIFNVMMMIPYGVLLRHIFKLSFKKVLLISFLTSLFFELTQLSGLFFIYPRPYRICDVDDLMTNTTGGALGWAIYPLLERYLPSADRNDKRKVLLGIDVSLLRRAAAAVFDASVCLAAAALAAGLILGREIFRSERIVLILYALFIPVLLLYHALFFVALKGQTPGILLAGLHLYSSGRKPVKLSSALVRPLIYYGVVYAIPFMVWQALTLAGKMSALKALALVAAGAAGMFVFTVYVFSLMLYAITRGYTLIYDRLAGTKLVFEHEIFGIKTNRVELLASLPLTGENVGVFTGRIVALLGSEQAERSEIIRYRLMIDAVMNDWLSAGFEGNLCELYLDKRFFRRAVVMSVVGDTPVSLEDFLESEELDYINGQESCTELMRNLRLSIDTYYHEGKNYCAIDMEGV